MGSTIPDPPDPKPRRGRPRKIPAHLEQAAFDYWLWAGSLPDTAQWLRGMHGIKVSVSTISRLTSRRFAEQPLGKQIAWTRDQLIATMPEFIDDLLDMSATYAVLGEELHEPDADLRRVRLELQTVQARERGLHRLIRLVPASVWANAEKFADQPSSLHPVPELEPKLKKRPRKNEDAPAAAPSPRPPPRSGTTRSIAPPPRANIPPPIQSPPVETLTTLPPATSPSITSPSPTSPPAPAVTTTPPQPTSTAPPPVPSVPPKRISYDPPPPPKEPQMSPEEAADRRWMIARYGL